MSALPTDSTPLPPTDVPLRSFWIGGSEGAGHVNAHGRPLDMVRVNAHLRLRLYPVVHRPDGNTPGHGHRSGLWDVQPGTPGTMEH